MVELLQPYLMKVRDGDEQYLEKVYDIIKRMVAVRYPNLNEDLLEQTTHRCVIFIWRSLDKIRFESPKQVTSYVNRAIVVQFAETYREFKKPMLRWVSPNNTDITRYTITDGDDTEKTTKTVTLVRKPLHEIVNILVENVGDPERIRTILTHWANGKGYPKIADTLGIKCGRNGYKVIGKELKKVFAAHYTQKQLSDLETAVCSWEESW